VRAVYPIAKHDFLTGAINMLTDTVKVALVTDTYDPADTVLADLTTVATAIVSVTEVTTDGRVLCNDVTFVNVTGATVVGAVTFVDGGPLIGFTDQRADTVPLSFTPNGGDVTLSYNYLVKL
jgi:hypothetical protein